MQIIDHHDQFVADLRSAGHPLAENFADGFADLDLLAATSPDIAQFRQAISWIIRQPRTADEKLRAMERLALLPKGRVEIPSMPQFTGWHDG